MAVPLPGQYLVTRRSRAIETEVGGIVDSSTVSPLLLLALVRTRCLRRIGDSVPVAPSAPKPLPAPEPVEIEMPRPVIERPAPKKWSKK